MATEKKVPNGLKLTVEGSILEVKVAFAAVTRKGLEYGGSLASSKKQEVSFSEFCAEPTNPKEVKEGKKAKPCCTKLTRKTTCEQHPEALHEVVMKGYNAGKTESGAEDWIFLTEEQVERFKARGEASIHITSLDVEAPRIPDDMMRLIEGVRYLVPVDAEDPETATKFEALRAFLGSRWGVARILWRRSMFYGLVMPAQAGGFFVLTAVSLGRGYRVPPVTTAGRLTQEQALVIAQKGREAAKGRAWSSDLVRDNPFTQGLKDAILAISEGRDVDEVEKPKAPKKELDIVALV
jgi:hypothetical protein